MGRGSTSASQVGNSSSSIWLASAPAGSTSRPPQTSCSAVETRTASASSAAGADISMASSRDQLSAPAELMAVIEGSCSSRETAPQRSSSLSAADSGAVPTSPNSPPNSERSRSMAPGSPQGSVSAVTGGGAGTTGAVGGAGAGMEAGIGATADGGAGTGCGGVSASAAEGIGTTAFGALPPAPARSFSIQSIKLCDSKGLAIHLSAPAARAFPSSKGSKVPVSSKTGMPCRFGSCLTAAQTS